ncbi:MAG TPA: lanthionine synthetase LanC family protein [Puia sp.]|nr:lanthionine synthetase LanC family protein [Puia sp.]
MENVANILLRDYSQVLDAYGLSYTPIDYYWQVGSTTKKQGWIIHLTVINDQIVELLHAVIPEMLKEHLSFKIIRNLGTLSSLLQGALGYQLLGKVVSIYPEEDNLALDIAKKLISITSSFRGPAIPTDRHLEGIVYTRYGSFDPILIKNVKGEWIKHIYDAKGTLIKDPYNIPFKMPENVQWPFNDITTPTPSAPRKLLNYAYYPLYTLKPDVKGNVLRALYFKKPWLIKSCIIKQGRRNMLVDHHGRDIQDRLKWQYELFKVLHKEVSMPEIFDCFTENEDTYLAMQYIKGKSLTNWILDNGASQCWRHLADSQRQLFLDMLLKILHIISRIHSKGFVHRDITPDNFLIDKYGNIFLIDMELAWRLNDEEPNPPFLLGTPGHMSPEQIAMQTPTIQQDIFSIGSLMITFFTSLHATKLKDQSSSVLQDTLKFFTCEYSLAKCISECWAENPLGRPELSKIIDTLSSIKERLNSTVDTPHQEPLSKEVLRQVIQKGLNNLSSPDLVDTQKRWFSHSQHVETMIANEQQGMALYEGWHTGISGPLWLVALAEKAGLSTKLCHETYYKGWEYLNETYFNNPAIQNPSLYRGSAGIALAISDGITSGLLSVTPGVKSLLQQCFSLPNNLLELANGIAGQGFSLLRCQQWMDPSWNEAILSSYVDVLLKNRQKDGSWTSYTGIDHGNAGILLFLLSYYQNYPSDSLQAALINCLQWFETNWVKKGKVYSWPLRKGSKHFDSQSFANGVPGIALTMIKSYELLQRPRYREMAISCLSSLDPYPVKLNISLSSGLTGWGEVYLEAYRVLKDPQWRERAEWIGQVLIYTFQPIGETTGHWLVDLNRATTADLFYGNAGVLHFMLRLLNPGQFKHPLLN